MSLLWQFMDFLCNFTNVLLSALRLTNSSYVAKLDSKDVHKHIRVH